MDHKTRDILIDLLKGALSVVVVCAFFVVVSLGFLLAVGAVEKGVFHTVFLWNAANYIASHWKQSWGIVVGAVVWSVQAQIGSAIPSRYDRIMERLDHLHAMVDQLAIDVSQQGRER